MKTYSNIEIIVKFDKETLLNGEMDTDTAQNLNMPATLENYKNMLTNRLQEDFPGAVITLEYGNYSGGSLFVRSDDWKTDTRDIEDAITVSMEQFYNMGAFWQFKDPAAVSLGKRGGSKTSVAKAASSAANGRLGGRPKSK